LSESLGLGGVLGSLYIHPLLAGQSRLRAASRKPNIVFVFADQMRRHVLGCYGNEQVSTPNFDRLAADGVRFTDAISVYPVCSPFRAMLMTGRYPMANGTVCNDTAVKNGLPTIAKVCKAHGYATGYIGKWHLEWSREPFVPKERRQGFDYWAARNCSHQYFDAFYCADTPEHIPLRGYEPVGQTELAVKYIRQHRDEPFCLFMSWGPPHAPYIAPDSYMKQFPAEKLKLRANVEERQAVAELLASDSSLLDQRQQQQRRQWRHRLDNDKPMREMINGYYAATKALDDCMGRLMQAVDEVGLGEDTIVVFTSDHGDMLGSHRMASKQMPYEESIGIPFLLRYPRKVPAGGVTDALLSPVDIMPTLLSLADLGVPAGIDGRDFSAAAAGGRSDQRDAVLLMKMLPGGNPWLANGVTPWRGVRTKRYTYARLLDRGPWLLFDHQKDPWQLENLINDPAHADLRAKLEVRMQELLIEAGDPVDAGVIAAYRNSRKQALHA